MIYRKAITTLCVTDTTHARNLSKVRTAPLAAGTTLMTDFKNMRTDTYRYVNLFLYTAVPNYLLKDDRLVLQQPATSTFHWVDALRAIDASNHTRAQAHVYGYLADHLRDTRDLATVNAFLERLDVAEWSPNVLAAILLATSYEKQALPARSGFFRRAVRDLRRRQQYKPVVFDKLK